MLMFFGKNKNKGRGEENKFQTGSGWFVKQALTSGTPKFDIPNIN
jgi:hypothetical protein